MSKWLALAVVSALAGGCYSSSGAFVCKSSNDCTGGPAGVCQPNGSCSFLDVSCPSGQRYGGLSGGQSGQCVDGSQPPPIDAAIDAQMIDAPPDAQACFGGAFLTVCLQSAPNAPLTISPPAQPINTDTSIMCATTTSITNGGNYCVIAATMISVETTLRATGTRPLVLLASDSITTVARIDVGSHRGASPETGAGADADSTDCIAGMLPGAPGGGGAGGSFLGVGGPGGAGGNGGAGGGAGPISTPVSKLRGGCAGQDGQGGNDHGAKGHGGGAVYLIAGNTIDIRGGINAAGEGGAGGIGNVAGAGGGGAGGMIGFDAPIITGNSLLLATGGGGGEGSDMAPNTPGQAGSDPTTTAAAGGGSGNGRGGDGGSGSAAIATPGGTGLGGDNTGTNRGGGGAGGGGAGLIKAPATAALGNQVAPSATP